MSGKLKVKGNIMLATKVSSFCACRSPASRLTELRGLHDLQLDTVLKVSQDGSGLPCAD